MRCRRLRLPALLAGSVAVAALTLAGCGAAPELPDRSAPASAGATRGTPAAAGDSATSSATGAARAGSHEHAAAATVAPSVVPLRKGERYLDLAMPTAYTPSPPTPTGTDDYRCFLLDPHLTKRTLVTGVDIVPGNPKVVHHVIVFKVGASDVARAQAADAATKGPGWTCFGDAGIGAGTVGNSLDDAPWVGAWAPGGGERTLPRGVGIPLDPGTRIVMQVHYNLLAGGIGPDTSRVRLRVDTPTASTQALQTMLLPAPVELPCRPGKAAAAHGLCGRTAAVADVRKRFGEQVAAADLLHLLCGPVVPGPTQSCTRTVPQRSTVWALAGHMHLLGKSIEIVLNQGRSTQRTLLDIPVWNFDDQGTIGLKRPVTVAKGDTLTVRCTHDQAIRDQVSALRGTTDRYVVWGEGTSDEMCLGAVLLTRG